MRLYLWEAGQTQASASAAGGAPPPVKVPVGFTTFPGEVLAAPRSWVEAVYLGLAYFKETNKGGHFKDPPPGAPVPPILPPQNGFLALDKSKFRESFAADVEADKAAFMADSQVPWGVEALSGTISEPAWKTSRAGTWWQPTTR